MFFNLKHFQPHVLIKKMYLERDSFFEAVSSDIILRFSSQRWVCHGKTNIEEEKTPTEQVLEKDVVHK